MKYHSGNCGVGGQYFKETSGVNIETAWSAFDWLLSVGDFSGNVCSDILRWYGGKHWLDMRRGNCDGGFTGVGQVIGYEWQMYDWLF